MKKLTSTLCTALLAVSASAQISTYNYSSAPGQLAGSHVIRTDTVSNVKVNGGGLPNFAPGANVMWDMSGVLYNAGFDYLKYDTSINVAFPTAKYTNNFVYNLTNTITYISNPKFAITSSGIFTYGEHIDQQTFPIGLLTGNSGDLLVLLTQDMPYTTAVKNMPYPCVVGTTNWATNTTFTTNMALTYANGGYNGQLVVRKSYVTGLDTAVGAGKIKAKRLDGTMGEPISVIQIKNVVKIKDSFFVNGSPMPDAYLNDFGVSQGQISNVYQYIYYRAGEVTAMMSVSYDDPNFLILHDITLHRERVPFNATVADTKNNSVVAVYPNPATSQVNVSIKDKSITNCTYQLLNVIGQSVANGNASVKGGDMSIKFADVPAGNYYLQLASNGEVIGKSAVTIIK